MGVIFGDACPSPSIRYSGCGSKPKVTFFGDDYQDDLMLSLLLAQKERLC